MDRMVPPTMRVAFYPRISFPDRPLTPMPLEPTVAPTTARFLSIYWPLGVCFPCLSRIPGIVRIPAHNIHCNCPRLPASGRSRSIPPPSSPAPHLLSAPSHHSPQERHLCVCKLCA